MSVRNIAVLFLFVSIFLPTMVFAQEATPDRVNIEKARVLEVTNQHLKTTPNADFPEVQTLKVEVLEGPDKGKITTFDNDYIQLKTGDLFYVRHESSSVDPIDFWVVSDTYRLNVLLLLGISFLALLFIFGGIQGIRGLASLLGSLILIFYVLLPDILGGYSPILVSIGVASLIIVVGSYITHGFNRTTTAAVVGMIVTVILTGLSAYWVVKAGHMTGYTGETNVFLNFNSGGNISMVGLLFGGIMIGLLGVLYDIAIGQAIVVEELFRAGKHMTHLEIYKRGIRIGREHIGALVNTLAIAYVGAALPLLLLFKQTYSSAVSVGAVINGEVFAGELVRIFIGGIGLVLAVPITTFVATYMLEKQRNKAATTEHTHSHHH